jgi:hypothetical protein
MRVFKTRGFARFAKSENIDDAVLLEASLETACGQVEADLGGGVFKKRIARAGEGKSGGYRVLLLLRFGGNAFFVYGFAKSERSNIGQSEKEFYKKLAKQYFSYTDKQIEQALSANKFVEIGVENG